MRSFRSIAVLGILLAGLVAYLYFVDSKKPVDQAEEKAKVFAGLEADKIEEVKIDTVAGDTTVVQKAADGWKLVEPDPGARRRFGAVIDHEQPRVGHDRAGRRRGGEESRRLRPQGAGRPGELQDEGRKELPHPRPGHEDADRQRHVRARRRREEGLPCSELPGFDVQPQAVRPARQEGPELRSREGRSRRDCRRRQAGGARRRPEPTGGSRRRSRHAATSALSSS